jgi:hypothetical protein
MDVKEMEGDGVDWIQPLQDSEKWQALVITVVNLRVPYNAGTFFGYRRTYQLLKKGSSPSS